MPSVLSPPAREALVADLRALAGDRCTTNPTQLEHHSHGESWHDPAAPDVVVFPTSTDDVSAMVKVAARHRAPVVPFGIGSSLEGHVNAFSGGVSIDFSRMSRVLAINADDLDATVEAGVTHRALNKVLNNKGLAFWVDPGADATIGGLAPPPAPGPAAVGHGPRRRAGLRPTVGLPDGPGDPTRRRPRQTP